MCFADEATQVGISHGGFGQDGHVEGIVHGIDAFRDRGRVQPDADLGPRDGLEPLRTGHMGELHGAVETIVVRQGQGVISGFPGRQDQLLGVGGAVQERVARVTMKLDIITHARR